MVIAGSRIFVGENTAAISFASIILIMIAKDIAAVFLAGEVRERAIGLCHAMHIELLLDRVAFVL